MTFRSIVVHLRGMVVPFDVAPQRNMRYLGRGEEEVGIPNDTVHRAAANDIDLKTRATRGSVCNGLLFGFFFGTASIVSNDRSILPEVFDLPPESQRHRAQKFNALVRCGVGMQIRVLKTFKDSNRRGLANVCVPIGVQSFDRFECFVKLLSVSCLKQ